MSLFVQSGSAKIWLKDSWSQGTQETRAREMLAAGAPSRAAAPLQPLGPHFLSRSPPRARCGPGSREPARSQAGEGKTPVNRTRVRARPGSRGSRSPWQERGRFCRLRPPECPSGSGGVPMPRSSISAPPRCPPPPPGSPKPGSPNPGAPGGRRPSPTPAPAARCPWGDLGSRGRPPSSARLLSERLPSDATGSRARRGRPSGCPGRPGPRPGPP